MECSIFVVLTILLQHHLALSQTGSDLKTLQDDLFTKLDYRKMVPPRRDLQVPITVHVSFHLNGINYLDEVEEKLTTTGFLELVWTDQYLIWDPANYSDIDYFYLPQSQVWKPDLTLQNGFIKLQELGDDVILVKIRHDGAVFWMPYEVFNTKCHVDIVKFPFDSQSCTLIFGAWTTSGVDTEFDLGVDQVELESFQPNGLWDLVSSEVKRTTSQNGVNQVEVTLNMTRKPQYYWSTIICPVLFLSGLAIFTFIIPVDSGEKISYSMTVYLAFAVFLTIVSNSLPVNSQTMSYLSTYLLTQLSLGTLIVMVTVVQVRLHNRLHSEVAPLCAQRFIQFTRRLQACFRVKSKPAKVNPHNSEILLHPQPPHPSSSPIPLDWIEDTHNNLRDTHGQQKRNITSKPSPAVDEIVNTTCEMKTEQGLTVVSSDGEMLTWADFLSALDLIFFCLFFTLTMIAVCVTMIFVTT